MNRYQTSVVRYLRAEINAARKAMEERNISRFRTICNMIRSELAYCSNIGLFSVEKEKLLLKIAERMIYSNDGR